MPNEEIRLDADEQQLTERLMDFAAKRAVDGVYKLDSYSRKHNAPVVLIIAFGEQALALNHVIMQYSIDQGTVLEAPAAKVFYGGQ